MIPDLYVFYKAQEEKGMFRVKPKMKFHKKKWNL